MLVVGNVVLRAVPFASAAVSAFASLRAVPERIVRGLHQRNAASGGQQAVERGQSRLRCRGAAESRQLQGLSRPQRHRLRRRAVAFKNVARYREECRKARRIDIRRFKIVRRAARPSGGAVALRDGSLPGDLLIGMRKQIQRNGQGLTLILGLCQAAAPAARRSPPPPVPCSRTGWRAREVCHETRSAVRRRW